MIRFLIIYKLKFFIRELNNPWKAFFSLLLLIIAWFYGLLFGQISNQLATGEIDVISPERFFNYTIIGISCLTIFRMFFPNYNPLKLIFPKYYPISKGKRYLTSLINDFQKTYFLYISTFILSTTFYLENSTFHFLITSSLVLINSHLIRRCLQYQIDFKYKKKSYFIHILGLSAIVSFFIIALLLKKDLLILLITLMMILTLIGYFQESLIESISQREIKSKSSKLSITIKLLLNNKKARLPLIIGLILKSFILLNDFILFRAKGIHLFERQFVFWIFASPLIVFTYVFNNIWGFWKNIWLNIDTRVGRYEPMIWLGLRLMLVTLVTDMVITIPIILLSWDDIRFFLIFYCTTSVYLIMLSFLWSLIMPRKILTIFQMKGSTSPLSNIAAMGGVLLLTTIKFNYWFYIFIPLFVIIGFVGLWLSLDMYKEKKYIIANKLLKE